jgi:hypothetical protein
VSTKPGAVARPQAIRRGELLLASIVLESAYDAECKARRSWLPRISGNHIEPYGNCIFFSGGRDVPILRRLAQNGLIEPVTDPGLPSLVCAHWYRSTAQGEALYREKILPKLTAAWAERQNFLTIEDQDDSDRDG